MSKSWTNLTLYLAGGSKTFLFSFCFLVQKRGNCYAGFLLPFCHLSVVFLLPIWMTTKSTRKPANKTTYLHILPKMKQKRKVFDLRKSMHLFSFSFWLTLPMIEGGWLHFLDWKLLYFWQSYFLTTLQGLGNPYLYFLT